MSAVEQVAESANATYRAIKALRARGLPKRIFEAERKRLEDEWWLENKHLFTK